MKVGVSWTRYVYAFGSGMVLSDAGYDEIEAETTLKPALDALKAEKAEKGTNGHFVIQSMIKIED